LSTETRAGRPASPESPTPGDPTATTAPPATSVPPAPVTAEPPEDASAPGGSNRRRNALILVIGVIVLDVLAFLLIPPYPKGSPNQPVSGIGDLITANLELPAPEVVYPVGHHSPASIAFFDPSISNTILTTWIVMALILAVGLIARLMLKPIPGRVQNLVEFAWEGLEGWATSLGGEGARRHIPLFVAFFLFILFSNWSGLLPVFGKLEFLRAPTSDVNVTIGLALVVFFYFQWSGFRALGVRRYLGKFFVFSGFKEGLAAGLIGLFVGLIEFLLEFIKPVTLAMRLFGNIFGGEVALGVITALTIAVVPAAMLLLEGLLNFVQALIVSTLMLMYTIIAVESHDDHEEHPPIPEGNIAPPTAAGAPAH
jgi:F-type H+-transporting ATPase subunit a